MRSGRPAGALHEQGVLAQSRVGLLHVRVPADVPRDLHGAARDGDVDLGNGRDQFKQSTYYVVAHGGVRGHLGLLHEHRHQRRVPREEGGPQADARHAVARRRVPHGAGAHTPRSRLLPGRDHRRVRGGRLPGAHSRQARCRCFVDHVSWSAPGASPRSASRSRARPERRRRAADRERRDPAAAVPLRRVHRSGQRPGVGDVVGRIFPVRHLVERCRPPTSGCRSIGPTSW